MITWDDPNERYFEHGVDHGVLYPSGADAVAWNGITGVTESGNGASTMYYIDGQVFLADVDPTDFSGSMTAYAYPHAFGPCIGLPEVAEGLVLDNQKPKRFGLSWRTLVGSGASGDLFGYQLHILYNAMASIGQKQRKTINNSPEPMELTMDLVATPVKLPGFRPTAHYIVDTRGLDPDTIAEIENILYVEGRLPDPTELFEMLNFGDAIIVTNVIADGTINIKGKRSNVYMTGTDTYQIDNVNATINPDGTYVISDGGDTDVILV